jgi:hypothetical protein
VGRKGAIKCGRGFHYAHCEQESGESGRDSTA